MVAKSRVFSVRNFLMRSKAKEYLPTSIAHVTHNTTHGWLPLDHIREMIHIHTRPPLSYSCADTPNNIPRGSKNVIKFFFQLARIRHGPQRLFLFDMNMIYFVIGKRHTRSTTRRQQPNARSTQQNHARVCIIT
jgi:hypothetical protein